MVALFVSPKCREFVVHKNPICRPPTSSKVRSRENFRKVKAT